MEFERSIKFAKYLPHFGWQPIVITTRAYGKDVSNGRLYDVVRAWDIQSLFRFVQGLLGFAPKTSERSQKAQTQSKPRWFEFADRYLLIPDRQIGWSVFALWPTFYLILTGGISAVYSSSPPASSHLLGLVISTLARKPWIMDLRDPWTYDSLNPTAMKGARLVLERWLEKACFRFSDAIILNTPAATNAYVALYPSYANKMTTITNGFDAQEFADAESTIRNDVKNEQVILLSHVGELSRRYDETSIPIMLLEVITELKEKNIIAEGTSHFQFIGCSDNGFSESIVKYGLANVVEIKGQVSHAEAVQQMLLSDCLLIFDPQRAPNTVPGKLYEYIGTGNPILAVLPDGAARDLLTAFPQAILIYPNDKLGLYNKLCELFHGAGLDSCEPSDPKVSHLDRKLLTKQLSDILGNVSSRSVN